MIPLLIFWLVEKFPQSKNRDTKILPDKISAYDVNRDAAFSAVHAQERYFVTTYFTAEK